MNLLQALEKQILVADGAMGTLLYSYGVGVCYEELNIKEPSLIKKIHKAYLQAGAQVIQTNTYGANYEKLTRYGLEDHVQEINRAAIRLAKEAVVEYVQQQQEKKMEKHHQQARPFILGTVGGIRGSGRKETTLEEIKRTFREQLYCLLLGHVDGILLETFYDFEELETVLMIARQETELPIIAQVSLLDVGVVQNGRPVADALEQLVELGANVVGINCRQGPFHMVRSFEEVPLPQGAFLSAYPNASLLDYEDGLYVYKSEPEYFGQKALDLREQGIRLMGGCCGTRPEHIAAMRKAVDGLQPITQKIVKKKESQAIAIGESRHQPEQPLHQLAQEKTTIIVELDTPKKLDLSNFLAGAKALKKAGINALTMADNSLATPRICNLSAGTIVKNQVGLRPLVHITCRDRNLIGLQSHLMGLHTLGIHDVLAVTGDPSKIGDFPGASSVYDLSSYELIRLIKTFNEGLSYSGQPLGMKTSFTVAAAFNPNVRHLDKAVLRLEKKIESGADFFISQPLFSRTRIKEVYEATKHLSAPLFIGIMPLVSSRNAEFLHHEVPGIELTDEIRTRMAEVAHDPAASSRAGLEIAKGLIAEAMQYFQGIYLITPFTRYDLTVELTQYIKQLTTVKEGIV